MTDDTRYGVLVVDHGSRRESANAMLHCVVQQVAAQLSQRETPPTLVLGAHMEIAPPTIDDAFEDFHVAGCDKVIVMPMMLSPGRHALEDIPRLAQEAGTARHIDVLCGLPLGADPLLAQLLIQRSALGSEAPADAQPCALGDGEAVSACRRPHCPQRRAD